MSKVEVMIKKEDIFSVLSDEAIDKLARFVKTERYGLTFNILKVFTNQIAQNMDGVSIKEMTDIINDFAFLVKKEKNKRKKTN
jgi:hypothetical protein